MCPLQISLNLAHGNDNLSLKSLLNMLHDIFFQGDEFGGLDESFFDNLHVNFIGFFDLSLSKVPLGVHILDDRLG